MQIGPLGLAWLPSVARPPQPSSSGRGRTVHRLSITTVPESAQQFRSQFKTVCGGREWISKGDFCAARHGPEPGRQSAPAVPSRTGQRCPNSDSQKRAYGAPRTHGRGRRATERGIQRIRERFSCAHGVLMAEKIKLSIGTRSQSAGQILSGQRSLSSNPKFKVQKKPQVQSSKLQRSTKVQAQKPTCALPRRLFLRAWRLRF